MINFFHRRQRERLPLPFTTDIHSHLVPGVDDGAPDAATAADLVERMASWGVKSIVTTPHVTQDTFENTPDILDPAFEELCDEVSRRGIPVKLQRSAEYRLDSFFRSQLSQGVLTPMPGNFLLLENSFHAEPPELDSFLYDLRLRGYRTILAHPERYLYYSRLNPRRYNSLYTSGTFFQVNILSLAGFYGSEARRGAEYLLEHGMVDHFATDLHSHRQADAIEAYLTSRDYARIHPRLASL